MWSRLRFPSLACLVVAAALIATAPANWAGQDAVGLKIVYVLTTAVFVGLGVAFDPVRRIEVVGNGRYRFRLSLGRTATCTYAALRGTRNGTGPIVLVPGQWAPFWLVPRANAALRRWEKVAGDPGKAR